MKIISRHHFRLLASFIATAVFCFAISGQAIIDATLQMQLGNPSNATSSSTNHNHYLIQRTVEALDFNDNLGVPNWASWDLTVSDIGSSGRSSSFFSDTTLPAGFTIVDSNDYTSSGYDRGHMCPSGDRTDNTTDNDLVFYMSNIIPQTAANNQGVWATFENYCRTLAQSNNELLIICGPSGFTGAKLPSGHVAIPTNTWKIVVVVPTGSGTALSRISITNRVISLMIPNSSSLSSSWQDYVTSAHHIELETGFTFFTALPGDVASAFRSRVDGQTGALPVVASFSPASGAPNSSVILLGSNFTSASTVSFNGNAAVFSVDSDTQITATVPANATSGFIAVTTPSGTATSTNSFTVVPGAAGGSPDLMVLASHSGTFRQGDTSDVCSLIVTNIGSGSSSNTVTVTNTLPTGITATAMSGTGWSCNLAALTATRTDALAAGSAYPPITVIVDISTKAASVLTNFVTVSGGGDTNLANNTGNDVITVGSAITGGTTNATLAGWNVSGQTNFGVSPLAATTNVPSLIVGGLTRGLGVGITGSAATRAWGGNNFASTSAAAAITAGQFVTFTLTAQSGYQVSYSAVNKFDYRRSSAGPPNGLLQYQIGLGSFIDVSSYTYPSNSSSGGSLSIDLASVAPLHNVGPGTNITFRIVNWGGTSSGGTWYIYDVANDAAADFSIQGTIQPIGISQPVLSNPHLTNGIFNFTLSGDVGVNYLVESTTNLLSWSSVGTFSNTTGQISISDTNAVNAMRAFRASVVP